MPTEEARKAEFGKYEHPNYRMGAARRIDAVHDLKALPVRGYIGDRFAWTSVSFGGGLNRRAGIFETPQCAHAAYVAEAKKHFGDYARAA